MSKRLFWYLLVPPLTRFPQISTHLDLWSWSERSSRQRIRGFKPQPQTCGSVEISHKFLNLSSRICGKFLKLSNFSPTFFFLLVFSFFHKLGKRGETSFFSHKLRVYAYMVEAAASTIYAYTLSYANQKQEQIKVADRRKMRFASKIPLKLQICCKKWLKNEAWEIRKKSKKPWKMERKWEIEHKSVRKSEKKWGKCAQISYKSVKRAWNHALMW